MLKPTQLVSGEDLIKSSDALVYYNRYLEGVRGVKETENSEQGFILTRTRIGIDKRDSGSVVLFCLHS